MPLPIGDDELKLKQRARRRLIGAIVLVTGLILMLPRVLDKEPKLASHDIEVHIPSPNRVPQNPDLAPPIADDNYSSPPPAVVAEPAKSTPSEEVEPQSAASIPAEPQGAPEPEGKAPVVASAAKTYYIQVGVFSKAGNAQTVQSKLAKSGLRVISAPLKSPVGQRTRIRVGPFSERSDADAALATVKRAGEKSAVIIALEKSP